MANAAKSRPPWMIALDNAEQDDEEFGPETQASIDEALAELRAGASTVSHEDLMRKTYGENWREVLTKATWPNE